MTCRGCGPSPDPEQDREHNDWCPDNPRRDLVTTDEVVRDLLAALEAALAACEALLAGSGKAAPLARIAIAKAKKEKP